MKKEDILFVVLALVAIFLILWYILGRSPTFEQVIIGLCLSNLALTIKLYGAFQEHMGWHKGKNSH